MANTIPVAKLLKLFETMLAEHWAYVWGSAEHGCVDCSGAFTYAYDQFGLSITHGSNAIARQHSYGLIPYSEAKAKGIIHGGMIALKCRKPGQDKYDLPEKYKANGYAYNGDLNDYYHIGLVSADGKYVLNAQGSKTGFVSSKIGENWSHLAYLKKVNYEGGVPVPEPIKMIVSLKNAKEGTTTVNFRKGTSTSSAIIQTLHANDVVEATEILGDWTAVMYNGRSGFIMSKFLEEYKEQRTVEERLADLEKRVALLEEGK